MPSIAKTNLHNERHLMKYFLLAVLCLAQGVAFGQAAASDGALLPLDRIFNKPYLAGSRPGGASISPDARWITFRWDSSAQSRGRMWMMRSDGSDLHLVPDTLVGETEWSRDARIVACTRKGDIFFTDSTFRSFTRITKTDGYESGLKFSSDGSLLAFESDGKLAALRVDRAGVIELAAPSMKDGSLNLIDFTGDSRRILFTESTDEGLPEFIVPKFTGKDVSTRSFKGGVRKSKIGIAPVDTGKTLWIALPGEERFFLGDISLSPDAKTLFIERFSPNRKKREIFLADTDSGKAKLIYEETEKSWIEGGLATTRWLPDGSQLITTSERDGWNHLYALTTGGKKPKQLSRGDWEIRWFDLAPDGRTIYFLANREAHSDWQLYALAISTGAIARLSSKSGTYDNPSLSKDGAFILASYSALGKPTEYVRVGTTNNVGTSTNGNAGATESQLTRSVPEEFWRTPLVIPEIIQFRARDGKSIPAMIYKPRDFSPSRKYPVVVFVHGAGYLQNVFDGWSYYYREFLFHTRLTQKGYVVFEVEYRGSAGLGRDFRADVYMHLGGKDLHDEIDGLEYLNGLGYIDPQRVGIYGGSYGGFMALMGLFTTDTYACAAALRAVTSWENYYNHNPWYTEARLGKPKDNPEAYRKSSPITFADSLKKPLLILHGMVDDNVFFQDAVQLIAKLQKAGKKFEVMMYPEEAHSFSEPESWYDEYSRIEEFFDKHLLR